LKKGQSVQSAVARAQSDYTEMVDIAKKMGDIPPSDYLNVPRFLERASKKVKRSR